MQVNSVLNILGKTDLSVLNGSQSDSDSSFSSVLESQNSETTLKDIFKKASETYGVPQNLLEAVGKQESNFKANATSRCGAQGIMQLMPATAASLGVKDAYDPEQNIMGGAKYLSQLLKSYNGDTTLALAAYNAGGNNVAKYGGVPPFKETQDYVVKVTGYMQSGVTLPGETVLTNGSSLIADDNASDDSNSGDLINALKNSDTLSDTLASLFSYNDYLKFIDIFLNDYLSTTANLVGKENNETKDTDQGSSPYSAYQNMQYGNSPLNLQNLMNQV